MRWLTLQCGAGNWRSVTSEAAGYTALVGLIVDYADVLKGRGGRW